MSLASVSSGQWAWSTEYAQPCRLVEQGGAWDDRWCRVWLPDRDAAVRVDADSVMAVEDAPGYSADHVVYLAAAARIVEAMAARGVLAPLEASVIPLPHQLRAVSRAMVGDRVRYLLADEVGLGKTIEAGLILRELKLRGLARRTLVVAPKGLVSQWVAEMRTHFGEVFRLVQPEDFSAWRRLAPDENAWLQHDQVVCSLDSVKPVDGRRGWTTDRVERHNRERYHDLLAAGWDLIIVDEAHRVGGSTGEVARHRLAQGLAEAAPYLLLRSATPHQRKTDAFHRLLSLLDAQAFPDVESVTRDRVHPWVIRTEKRAAVDADGAPLFKPRHTRLVPVAWTDRHRLQEALYEAVTEYVREGYNQALLEKQRHIGFLMLLMQRLVTSSTHAIRGALERRLDVLREPDEQLGLFPEISDEEWAELDGQEQAEGLLTARLKALRNEREEVRLLLEAAGRTGAAGPDAKAEALLDWIYRVQQEEGDPELKVLVFTEFVATQEMLREFLTSRGFTVVCLNGTMGVDERTAVQDAFRHDARILISTDAGGEGLNLQFCHVVVNYDIPWNPMRLEQRIGRVDRIGQERPVRAINLTLEGTVEHRVRAVLEEKLAVILAEFGVDKTGDILDSAEGGPLFDDLYVTAIMDPTALPTKAEELAQQVRRVGQQERAAQGLLAAPEPPDPQIARAMMNHPIPHWVEAMTVHHVRARGGAAERTGRAWLLTWPGSNERLHAVFSARAAKDEPGACHLTLEDPRVREVLKLLPAFAPGQPVPAAALDGLASDVQGVWGLWRVLAHAANGSRERIVTVFVHADGRVLAPTARFVWDLLLSPEGVRCSPPLPPGMAREAFQRAAAAAQEAGRQAYEELVQAHEGDLLREREKGQYSFAARHRALQRIGLPAVRDYRLRQLAQEQDAWEIKMAEAGRVSPELVPLLVFHVIGAASHG